MKTVKDSENTDRVAVENDAPLNPKLTCGIVMPISAIDGYSASHWGDVYDILADSISGADFVANMVSNTDEVGIIHKTIIQNLYDNPIVVCDVSGKNPNVMFELGLRLAFDKPTIIVKDDVTTYSFDTSNIEHLEYPRDLRFAKIVEFKKKLTDKITATHKKATSDKDYTTFLKHFGEFTVAKLNKKEVSGQEYILEELRGLKLAVRSLERPTSRRESSLHVRTAAGLPNLVEVCLNDLADEGAGALRKSSAHPAVASARTVEHGNHQHLEIIIKPQFEPASVLKDLGLHGRERRKSTFA